jgi:hypothetical protein
MLNGCTVNYTVPMQVGALILSNAKIRSTNGLGFGKWLASEPITEGTDTNASVDNAAGTTNGGLFHAHLDNIDATGVSVKVQHSTNNSTWVDLAEVVFGAHAIGGYTFALNPSDTNTILFNGVTFTFVTTASTATNINIKGSLALTMAEAAIVLNASVNASVSVATYTATATGVNVSYDAPGTGGKCLHIRNREWRQLYTNRISSFRRSRRRRGTSSIGFRHCGKGNNGKQIFTFFGRRGRRRYDSGKRIIRPSLLTFLGEYYVHRWKRHDLQTRHARGHFL